MTLTIPHKSGSKLPKLLDVLFDALSRFRKTVFFKRHIFGWARGVEVTWSKNAGFHPHVHFVVEAAFMDIDALHATWANCVRKAGGGEVTREGVDLKGLREGIGLSEAIGYPFKADALSSWPGVRILELARAVKGRRMFACARKWNRLAERLEAEEKALRELEGGWEVVPFRDFVEQVRLGESWAVSAVPSVLEILDASEGLESATTLLLRVSRPPRRANVDSASCSLA